jgi:hypothetical protein
MRCPKCLSTRVNERPERTAQGYWRFRRQTSQYEDRAPGCQQEFANSDARIRLRHLIESCSLWALTQEPVLTNSHVSGGHLLDIPGAEQRHSSRNRCLGAMARFSRRAGTTHSTWSPGSLLDHCRPGTMGSCLRARLRRLRSARLRTG